MSIDPSNWGAEADVLFPNGKLKASLMYIRTGPNTYVAWDGTVEVEVTSSGSAIQDGADPDIKATVLDFLGDSPTSVNPVAVILTDTDGEPYNASGGGGGGAVTIADGADVVEGELADAAVTGDNAGTVSAKLRGINKILADVWDSVNGRLDVFIQNSTLAVTQSGTWNLTNITGSVSLPTNAAQETGGNLAAIAASASVLDDWDETDRCKVNIIAGQAGITAGAGNVAANTPRTTLASDDPAVAVLGATTGAAVITDANGTIQQYLRGLVKLAITAGSWLAAITATAKSPDGTDPGSVSEDVETKLIADLNKILYVNQDDPTKKHVNFNGSSAYTDQQIAAAPGSGLRTVITRIRFSSGTAAAINLFLEEGSTKIAGPYYLEAVAGRGLALDVFIPVTANTAVTFTTSVNNAQSVEFEYITKKV